MIQHDVYRHRHIRQADCAESYRSSTFFSFLLLQLLDGLQQASVVGDSVHPGVFLIFFRVHVPQQLNNVDVLLLLWTFLLRWCPENKSSEIRNCREIITRKKHLTRSEKLTSSAWLSDLPRASQSLSFHPRACRCCTRSLHACWRRRTCTDPSQTWSPL